MTDILSAARDQVLDRGEGLAELQVLEVLQLAEFAAGGINAIIVGNYLTNLGRPADRDLEMLDQLRMACGAAVGWWCR